MAIVLVFVDEPHPERTRVWGLSISSTSSSQASRSASEIISRRDCKSSSYSSSVLQLARLEQGVAGGSERGGHQSQDFIISLSRESEGMTMKSSRTASERRPRMMSMRKTEQQEQSQTTTTITANNNNNKNNSPEASCFAKVLRPFSCAAL